MQTSAALLRRLILVSLGLSAIAILVGWFNTPSNAWQIILGLVSWILGILYSLAYRAWLGDVSQLTLHPRPMHSGSTVRTWLNIGRWLCVVGAVLGVLIGILIIIIASNPILGTILIVSSPFLMISHAYLGVNMLWVEALSNEAEQPGRHLGTVLAITPKMLNWMMAFFIVTLLSLLSAFQLPRDLKSVALGYFSIALSVLSTSLSAWQIWETRRFATFFRDNSAPHSTPPTASRNSSFL